MDNDEVMATYNIMDTSDMDTSDVVCAGTSDVSTTSFNTSLNESGEASSREFACYSTLKFTVLAFQRHQSVRNVLLLIILI